MFLAEVGFYLWVGEGGNPSSDACVDQAFDRATERLKWAIETIKV